MAGNLRLDWTLDPGLWTYPLPPRKLQVSGPVAWTNPKSTSTPPPKKEPSHESFWEEKETRNYFFRAVHVSGTMTSLIKEYLPQKKKKSHHFKSNPSIMALAPK